MDKVLVEVFIPASGESYDVFIPAQSKLYEVTFLLANTMTELSGGYFVATDTTVVCDRETGTIFDINQTVEELGFLNGKKLMLV
ncbi:methyltransferase [Bacillus sp. HNG]|uniref:methyltransferase n=1 Tax=Bacillaceae TaxID=186817 RepID=UPI000E2F0F63|nr:MULTISPECIES: methyltransferase [Bacillaceae]MDR4889952.1 methyltransferase [Fredinandcohnia sp. QZ13]RFB14913.1 methyltransferase [Bacillus sp. HNG]